MGKVGASERWWKVGKPGRGGASHRTVVVTTHFLRTSLVPDTLHTLSQILRLCRIVPYHLHFTEEQTEAQGT